MSVVKVGYNEEKYRRVRDVYFILRFYLCIQQHHMLVVLCTQYTCKCNDIIISNVNHKLFLVYKYKLLVICSKFGQMIVMVTDCQNNSNWCLQACFHLRFEKECLKGPLSVNFGPSDAKKWRKKYNSPKEEVNMWIKSNMSCMFLFHYFMRICIIVALINVQSQTIFN